MMNIGNIQSSGYTNIGSSSDNSGMKAEQVLNTAQNHKASVESSENLSHEEMRKRLMDAVETANNSSFLSLNNNIKFGFHENSKEMFVSVVDVDTNKKIRQMPSEEALSLLASMKELVGQIFDTKG